MRRSVMSRGIVLLAATAALGVATAPAFAAAPDYSPVAQASATAASVKVAGSGTNTGSYVVRNDGSTQTAAGSNRPLITALGGQSFLSAGTLAQDATTSVEDGKGRSAACSGLAGDGATLVSVGDGDCLRGGDTLSLDVASLDLSNLKIIQSDLFQGIDTKIQSALGPYQSQLTNALSGALTQAVNALGDPALHLDLGAVQSRCTATTTSATGSSDLAGVGAWIQIPGVGRVDLMKLPVDPGPNTHVVTNLSGVVDAIVKPLQANLTDTLPNGLAALPGGLNTALQPVLQQLGMGFDSLRTALEQNVLDTLSSQLKPLQDNLLDITLNKQVRGDHSISVTALDLSVLPAARQFVGSDLAHLTVGTSTCGPNRGVSARTATATAPPAAPKPPARAPEHVPTVVESGYADAADATSPLTPGRAGLLGLVALAAAGGGLVAYRRARR